MSVDKAKTPSLRLRIAVTVAALALLVILVQAAALLVVLDDQKEDFINEILNHQIGHSLEEYTYNPAEAIPNTPNMRLYRAPADAYAEAPPELVAKLPVGNHEVHDGEIEYHVAVRAQGGARYVLVYDVAEHERRMEAIVFLTVAGALLIGLVTLAAVYALAGRLTRSLDALARRVTHGGRAGGYAAPGTEREVLAVARALDAYDRRQAELLARERDFTANLSHELRTPLTAIRTDAELLASLPDLPPGARRRAQRITETVDRVAELARSLLLLAREAEPKLPEDINLLGAVNQAWEPLAGRARDKHLDLRLEIPAGAVVRADASLLDLTLRNLLENAVRHSGPGEILCRFEQSSLVVEDCGPGIPAADLGRMFERFYRGEAGGHGLGLALVKHVCDACGWRVAAGNAPGGGARLAIDFGAAARADAAAPSRIPHTSLTNS